MLNKPIVKIDHWEHKEGWIEEGVARLVKIGKRDKELALTCTVQPIYIVRIVTERQPDDTVKPVIVDQFMQDCNDQPREYPSTSIVRPFSRFQDWLDSLFDHERVANSELLGKPLRFINDLFGRTYPWGGDQF
jgi:hypothetical protein